MKLLIGVVTSRRTSVFRRIQNAPDREGNDTNIKIRWHTTELMTK